jgi:hypothetical protein
VEVGVARVRNSTAALQWRVGRAHWERRVVCTREEMAGSFYGRRAARGGAEARPRSKEGRAGGPDHGRTHTACRRRTAWAGSGAARREVAREGAGSNAARGACGLGMRASGRAAGTGPGPGRRGATAATWPCVSATKV